MSRYSKPLALRPTLSGAMPDVAMVMAAGLGKRMRPLTASRPKPLVAVAGRTLLDHAFDRLEAAGIKRAVVNVHYLADAIEAHLARRAGPIEVAFSDERARLMETGGGIVQALPLLGPDPFFVVNSDNLWVDGPVDTLRLLGQRWNTQQMDALLLVVPLARANGHKGQGDFHMDPVGHLSRRKPGRVAPFVYTGVQLISPLLFEAVAAEPFSTNLIWDKAIAARRAFGLVHQGLWFDVGTPAAIPIAEALLAHG